jgi:hypothetical protein
MASIATIPPTAPRKASMDTKIDSVQLEQVMSGDELDKEHMDYNRVDGEVAKYATAQGVEISPGENSRLKKMIDKRVLVIMVITYFIQALDKGTLSFSSIMGIRTDLHLVGQQVCTPTSQDLARH